MSFEVFGGVSGVFRGVQMCLDTFRWFLMCLDVF